MAKQGVIRGLSWDLGSRGKKSSVTEKAFEEGDRLVSRILPDLEGYKREDLLESEWSDDLKEDALFHWRSTFRVPPIKEEAPFKEEDADEKLRELVARQDPDQANTIYILALMLERKKILIERGNERDKEGQLLRLYEHKEDGESFLILDPQPSLEEIIDLQLEVALQLGWIQEEEEEGEASEAESSSEESADPQQASETEKPDEGEELVEDEDEDEDEDDFEDDDDEEQEPS